MAVESTADQGAAGGWPGSWPADRRGHRSPRRSADGPISADGRAPVSRRHDRSAMAAVRWPGRQPWPHRPATGRWPPPRCRRGVGRWATGSPADRPARRDRAGRPARRDGPATAWPRPSHRRSPGATARPPRSARHRAGDGPRRRSPGSPATAATPPAKGAFWPPSAAPSAGRTAVGWRERSAAAALAAPPAAATTASATGRRRSAPTARQRKASPGSTSASPPTARRGG